MLLIILFRCQLGSLYLRRHQLGEYYKSNERCNQTRDDRLAKLNTKQHTLGNMLQIYNYNSSRK